MTKRRKTNVLATKVAQLAQKNLAFTILKARLMEELHGEMSGGHGHLQGLCPADKIRCDGLILHCGNKELFWMAFQPCRRGVSHREKAAGPGFFFPWKYLGYILVFGPALNTTLQLEESWYLGCHNQSSFLTQWCSIEYLLGDVQLSSPREVEAIKI